MGNLSNYFTKQVKDIVAKSEERSQHQTPLRLDLYGTDQLELQKQAKTLCAEWKQQNGDVSLAATINSLPGKMICRFGTTPTGAGSGFSTDELDHRWKVLEEANIDEWGNSWPTVDQYKEVFNSAVANNQQLATNTFEAMKFILSEQYNLKGAPQLLGSSWARVLNVPHDYHQSPTLPETYEPTRETLEFCRTVYSIGTGQWGKLVEQAFYLQNQGEKVMDSLQKEVKAWASYEISTEQLLKRTEIVTDGYTEGVSLKPSPLPGLVEFLKDLHRINFKMAEVAAQKVIEAQRNPTPAADALVAATKRFLTRSNVPMACPAEVVNKSSRCEIAVDPFADERYTWVEGVKVWKEDSTS